MRAGKDRSLIGKNIIVTGTKSGIGLATVETLAQKGANVWACMRQPDEIAEARFAEAAGRNQGWIRPVYFDVTDPEQIKNGLAAVFAEKKSIDGLVNAAGLAHGGLFQMTPIHKIRDVFDVNLFAAMEITQRVLKVMMRQRSGSVVNVASISGLDLKAGNSAYGVSKAAMIAWTQVLAAETASAGVRVNAVAPGLTDTRMATMMEEKAGSDMIQRSAMKRMATPAEIAATIRFLLSDEASFINGETIRIDGGRS